MSDIIVLYLDSVVDLLIIRLMMRIFLNSVISRSSFNASDFLISFDMKEDIGFALLDLVRVCMYVIISCTCFLSCWLAELKIRKCAISC